MKINSAILPLLSVVLFGAFCSATAQQLITVSYEGTVMYAGNPQVPSFSIGDPFRLTFTFDPGTPDASPGDPTVGQYTGAVRSLSFEVGSYSGYADPNQSIRVWNDHIYEGSSYDLYQIAIAGSSLHGSDIPGWTPFQFVFQLVDPTHTAFASDALPFTTLDPQKFLGYGVSFMSLQFIGPGGSAPTVIADISNPVPTPEEAIEDLISSLSDPDLGLDAGQVASLSDKLNNALASIQNGDYKQAENQLNAFINQIDAAKKTGRMPAETADALIAAAQEIIALIS